MILHSIPELTEPNEKFENGAQYLTKDSFSFHSQLGSGAFGKVYKVSSKLTSNIYALKVLSKNQITNLKLTEQLKKEIAIIAKCNHDNIIKLYGAFEDKSYIYLIMELANDSTLFSKLKKSKKLSESQTAIYLADIVRALVYLHSQKPAIIHRDLKPENILLNDGRCKIADFGWSNITDEFRNTFCGTPDYLAPEMIIGTGHDEKLDVWTIGVMMYELIEGQPPFTAKEKINDARVMQKLIEKNILSGNIEFGKEITEDAKNAIKILLNPKSDFRPTAKEILDLNFFKKHIKEQPSSNELYGKDGQKNSIEGADSGALRQKLGEYKEKCSSMFQTIQQLNELVQSKEATIRSVKRENEILTKSNQKLISEVAQLKSSDSKSSNGNELSDLTEKYKNLSDELYKQEETIGYLFRRIRHVSEVISEFYQNCVIGVNTAPLPSQAITYENSMMKLEQIFKDFNKYKSATFTSKGEIPPNMNIPKAMTESGSGVIWSEKVLPGSKSNIRNFSPMANKPSDEKKNISSSLEKILNDSKSALVKFFRKAD